MFKTPTCCVNHPDRKPTNLRQRPTYWNRLTGWESVSFYVCAECHEELVATKVRKPRVKTLVVASSDDLAELMAEAPGMAA